MEFRKRARQRRVELDLTQQEVATAAGMSLRAYQNFETGTTKPQESNRDGIVRALGLTEEQELDAEGDDEFPEDVRVFLNALGAFLMTLEDEPRMRFIQAQTRDILVSYGEAQRTARRIAQQAREMVRPEPPAPDTPGQSETA